MPFTANEGAPVATTTAAAQPPENPGDLGQTSRRIDAVGSEIAVTVHASRYSAGARGVASKNLPPIHEDTRTVIIFSTGAVVRLSASVTTGELVVLTNQQSGDDVICRVANVKTQPGIQNYVNLEFTQRAPNFWGEAIQSERPARPEPAAIAPVVMPTKTPERIVPQAAQVARPPAPRAPIVMPAAELASAVQAVTDLLNAVPGSAVSPARGAAPVVTRSEKTAPVVAEKIERVSVQTAALPREISIPAISPQPADQPASHQSSQSVGEQGGEQAQAHSVSQAAADRAPATPGKAGPTDHSTSWPGSAGAPVETSSINASAPAAKHADVATELKNAVSAGVGTDAQINPSSFQNSAQIGVSTGAAANRLVPTFGSISGFTPAVENNSQEWMKSQPLSMGSEGQPAGSKKILTIAVAAVVLLIVGGAGGAVLFRQSRPDAAQQAAVAQATAATAMATPRAPDASDAVAPAVTTSSVSVEPETPASRVASVASPKTSQPAKVETAPDRVAPDSSPLRPKIAVGNLSAPISKTARPAGSFEPPPDVAAAVSNLADNNLIANAARNAGPAVPAAPAVLAHPGGQIKQPTLISSPRATYPPAALRARREGVVVIDALIDETGKVASMKVVSGTMDLQQAAMDAVHNWKYQPAQLNGQPIAVHTRVTVDFHLQ